MMDKYVWNYIVELSNPISALAMVFMTYYVYKLTNKSNKKESYLRYIIELYYNIEEDSKVLFLNNLNSNQYQVRQAERRIKANCTLMIYYLLRIPGFYDGRLKFFAVLHDTSIHPNNVENYEKIADGFNKFCREIRDKSKGNHTYSFDYDGSPIEK